MNINIERTSCTPLYIQLANELKTSIRNGEPAYGEKLPSENELMKELSLSRMTVRNAVSILFNEHYITKQQGKGTFVCYTPSISAGSVDVLLNIVDYFTIRYIRGISGVLEENRYSFRFYDTYNSQEEIVKILSDIIINGSSGVIIEPSNINTPLIPELKEMLMELSAHQIPYVLIDHEVEGLPGTRVIVDDYKGGRTAADHLISLGHKRCAMCCDYSILETRLRYKGFASVFSEAGLPDVNAFSRNDPPSFILSEIRNRKITGIFCTSDQIAYELIKMFNDVGLNVPKDISIIGYDDTDLAEITSPSLTSVAHPKTGLALTAANKLIRIINHQDAAGASELMSPKIAVRNSTAALTSS